MTGRTIRIEKAILYDGPVRILVIECTNCGRRMIKEMTKCPGCGFLRNGNAIEPRKMT